MTVTLEVDHKDEVLTSICFEDTVEAMILG